MSKTHPVGKAKAKFLRTFGFNEKNIDLLTQGLLKIARQEAVEETVSSFYGTKYVIDGSLKTPKEPSVNVRAVWIIETGEENPRFVTARPM